VAEHGGDETGKWQQQSGGRGAEGPEPAAAGRQGGGRVELAGGGAVQLHETTRDEWGSLRERLGTRD
jgi:hypothetical protein